MNGHVVRARGLAGKRLALLVAMLLVLAATPRDARAGFFDNLAKRLTKTVGGAFTEKTDDLKDAIVDVRFIQNLYPKGLSATTEEDILFGDVWKEGQNLVTLRCFKQGALMMYEIEGTVKLDGEAVPYAGTGLYGKVVADLNPHTFTVETKKGLKYEFTAKPGLPIKIEAPRDAEVVCGEPMPVRLSNPAGSEKSMVRLFLHSRASLTQKGWATLVNARSADQITVPPVCFRSRPAQGDIMDKDSNLLAERWQVDTSPAEGVAGVRTISLAWDVAPVKVKGTRAANENRPQAKEGGWINNQVVLLNREARKEKMAYHIFAMDAYNTRPLAKARKLAVVAFTVRATKLSQERTAETTTIEAVPFDLSPMITGKPPALQKVTRTYDMKQEFPQFPKEWWDAIAENLYTGMADALKRDAGIELVPVDQVLNAKSYALLPEAPDKLSKVEYLSTYRGLKDIQANGAFKSAGSQAFGLVQQQFLSEVGADGVMTVNVDLEMPWGQFSLRPRVVFGMTGAPNGPHIMGTTLGTGSIAGEGIELKKLVKGKEFPPDILEQCIRRDAILDAFGEAVRRLKETEDTLGYSDAWALQ